MTTAARGRAIAGGLPRSLRLPFALLLGLGSSALPAACGTDSVKSPFGPGAGGGGGEAGMQGDAGFRLIIDAGNPVDETLGGPCEDDGQCDDRLDCTRDHCDAALGRCRLQPHEPRDAEGDGDATRNCGGGDCDDADPLSSSSATEICGNGKDDNCDGNVDE